MFLNCNGIDFAYSANKTVLNGVSFSLKKGETLAIVGASGCGKSTLLRVLSGILPNSDNCGLQGTVEIDSMTPDQYRRTGKLAFMFQEATLMPHLTVKQNIELPLKIKGQSNEPKISKLMEEVGLTEYANYLPKQLSGGMKTRVSLARAFVDEPELLLLDEPFSALDIGWKSDLYKRLVSLFHTTLVFVTHDVQEAILLANEIIVLTRKGFIETTFPVKSIPKISDRVNDIAGLVTNENFNILFSAIQQRIITDAERALTTEVESKKIIDAIEDSAGNIEKEKSFRSDATNIIRAYANTRYLNAILTDSFKKAKTDYFKYNLLWDILEYTNLSSDAHQQYFDYYFENISQFADMSRSWYKTENDEAFFQILKGRIESRKGFNQNKKWIYVCDLYAVKNLSELIPFLDEIINGNIEEVNFPLAIQAAKLVKAKMKNEKQDIVHIA